MTHDYTQRPMIDMVPERSKDFHSFACSSCATTQEEVKQLKSNLDALEVTNATLYQKLEECDSGSQKQELQIYLDKIMQENEVWKAHAETLKEMNDSLLKANQEMEDNLKQLADRYRLLKQKMEKIAEIADVDIIIKCVICFENSVNMVFVPCGHKCCAGCGTMALKSKMLCPLCRAPVRENVLMYDS